MRHCPLDEDAIESNVQNLLGRGGVDATGQQESVTNYPVRSVLTPDKYPTKEGNDSASGAPKGRRERYRSQQKT